MILLLLTTLALASDVYEICVLKNQTWSDENQTFYTKQVRTFYTFDTIQFIVHKNSVEVNRERRAIQSKETIDGLSCMREHKNSVICFDEKNNQFLWEVNRRNGQVTRDILKVCRKNGE